MARVTTRPSAARASRGRKPERLEIRTRRSMARRGIRGSSDCRRAPVALVSPTFIADSALAPNIARVISSGNLILEWPICGILSLQIRQSSGRLVSDHAQNAAFGCGIGLAATFVGRLSTYPVPTSECTVARAVIDAQNHAGWPEAWRPGASVLHQRL